jgi:hypothetical protein
VILQSLAHKKGQRTAYHPDNSFGLPLHHISTKFGKSFVLDHEEYNTLHAQATAAGVSTAGLRWDRGPHGCFLGVRLDNPHRLVSYWYINSVHSRAVVLLWRKSGKNNHHLIIEQSKQAYLIG